MFSWGGDNLGRGGNINSNVTFLNYWSAYAGVERDLTSLSTQALRGGPGLLVPAGTNGWGGISTDARKALYAEFNGWFFHQDESGGHASGIDPAIVWHPSSGVDFTLGPSVQWRPSDRTHFDIVPMWGTTKAANRFEVFVFFGFEFGDGSDDGDDKKVEPASLRGR